MINSFKAGFAPRPQQVEIITKTDDAFHNKGKKFVIVSAPTGVGKSLISNVLGNYSPEPHKDWVELVQSYEVHKKIAGSNKTRGWTATTIGVI